MLTPIRQANDFSIKLCRLALFRQFQYFWVIWSGLMLSHFDTHPDASGLEGGFLNINFTLVRIMDFLFYYLTLWFTQNKQQLSWSTPPERAAYAMTICTIFWSITLWQIWQVVFPQYKNHHLTPIPLFIAGVSILLVYQYIYIKKNRYELIISTSYKHFSTNDKKGVVIAIIFALMSAILPFALAALLGYLGDS